MRVPLEKEGEDRLPELGRWSRDLKEMNADPRDPEGLIPWGYFMFMTDESLVFHMLFWGKRKPACRRNTGSGGPLLTFC